MRYPVPSRCPVCGRELHVTRLACGHCGSTLEGAFELPKLARLAPEYQRFIELFIRSEGKLNRVQEALGVSYPTAKAQLHEVIRALGYEPLSAEEIRQKAVTPEQRRRILDDLAAGRITSDEAIQMLQGAS